MSPLIHQILVIILNEARDTYRVLSNGVDRTEEGLTKWCQFVHSQVVDRWYRFIPFGVTSRKDLARVTVIAQWETSGDLPDGEIPCLRTSIRTAGTVLEGK